MDLLKCLCCRSKRQRPLKGSLESVELCYRAVPFITSPFPTDDQSSTSTDMEVAGPSSTSQESELPSRAESQVGTRARFTYELDREWIPADGGADAKLTLQSPPIARRAKAYGLERFDRNAMLILAQSSPHGRQYVEQRVEMLTRSFGQFRFVVEAHVDLGPNEMEACLENFFSRDWAGAGAACVAAVGGAAEAGYLSARAQRVPESRVLRWLTDQLPSALAGRPRIYITEVERSGAVADSHVYSLPITRSFPDVIGVHIPVIIEGESSPLQMLCSRLGSERDFFAEVTAAAHAAETAFPALAHRPIQVETTLLLELELVKTTEESITSELTESAPTGDNSASENVPDGVNHTSVSLPDVAKVTLQGTLDSTSETIESLTENGRSATERVPDGTTVKLECLSSGTNGVTDSMSNVVNGTTQSLTIKARAGEESSPDDTYVKIQGSNGGSNRVSEAVRNEVNGAKESLSNGVNEDLETLCDGVNATIDSLCNGVNATIDSLCNSANGAQTLPDGGSETAAQAS